MAKLSPGLAAACGRPQQGAAIGTLAGHLSARTSAADQRAI